MIKRTNTNSYRSEYNSKDISAVLRCINNNESLESLKGIKDIKKLLVLLSRHDLIENKVMLDELDNLKGKKKKELKDFITVTYLAENISVDFKDEFKGFKHFKKHFDTDFISGNNPIDLINKVIIDQNLIYNVTSSEGRIIVNADMREVVGVKGEKCIKLTCGDNELITMYPVSKNKIEKENAKSEIIKDARVSKFANEILSSEEILNSNVLTEKGREAIKLIDKGIDIFTLLKRDEIYDVELNNETAFNKDDLVSIKEDGLTEEIIYRLAKENCDTEVVIYLVEEKPKITEKISMGAK